MMIICAIEGVRLKTTQDINVSEKSMDISSHPQPHALFGEIALKLRLVGVIGYPRCCINVRRSCKSTHYAPVSNVNAPFPHGCDAEPIKSLLLRLTV